MSYLASLFPPGGLPQAVKILRGMSVGRFREYVWPLFTGRNTIAVISLVRGSCSRKKMSSAISAGWISRFGGYGHPSAAIARCRPVAVPRRKIDVMRTPVE
jgi:hypothetical protein